MAYSVVGKSLPRVDGLDKATGAALYAGDYHLPNMLCGKVLRSPLPHARIVRLDTHRAQALAGVVAVITAQDLPQVRYGNFIKDQEVFARHEVRLVGEPLAAVAAIDEATAEEALELIDLELEPLPALRDAREAMNPQASLVHEEAERYVATLPLARRGNILNQSLHQRGDVERGFAQADVIVEGSFRTPSLHGGYIETHECVVAIDRSGKITIWTSTQSPFRVRDTVAETLRVPMARVRAIGVTTGGGFGAKATPCLEPIAAALALKTQRPLRLSMTRGEEYGGSFVRHASFVDLKIGAKRDGSLVAIQGRVIYDTGAYAAFGPQIVFHALTLQGPYRCPNIDLAAYVVYTHNPVGTAIRAPGAPQVTFAVESLLDELAARLGLDPLELRRRNGVVEGDPAPGAYKGEPPKLVSVALLDTMGGVEERLRAKLREYNGHWSRRVEGRVRALGVASGQWHIMSGGAEGGPSAVELRVAEDGSLMLLTGAMEIGGGTNTSLAQIAAEGLGVGLEDVTVVAADTDTTPFESPTVGSSVTYRVGNSVRLAALDAKRQLLKLAAQRLEANVEDLELADKKVVVKGSPQKAVALATLAKAATSSLGGPIIGTSTRMREDQELPAISKGTVNHPCYVTHLAEVEVDPETGSVQLLEFLAAHDVGFAINPLALEGQIDGGVVHALGHSLWEEVHFDEKGRYLNPNFLDYKLPTALDVPNIQKAIIEKGSWYGPYGAKGIGEPPVIPVAPALNNAISNALGVRIRELPLTPEKICRALKKLPT